MQASIRIRNLSIVSLAIQASGVLRPDGRVEFRGLNARQHQRVLRLLTRTLTAPLEPLSTRRITVRDEPLPAHGQIAVAEARLLIGSINPRMVEDEFNARLGIIDERLERARRREQAAFAERGSEAVFRQRGQEEVALRRERDALCATQPHLPCW
jgi:hypothetical protein